MCPEMNRKIPQRSSKSEAMRAYHSFFVLAFLGILLAGCSDNPAQTQLQPAGPSIFKGDRYSLPINHPIASTGCGKAPPVQVGTSLNVTIPEDPVVANGAHTRMYVVHIPRTYDPQRPQALILVLHGAGGSAVGTAQGNQFTSLGDQQDFFGERWTHCQQGAEVAHYVVIGGGHGLPSIIAGQSMASLTWAFFQAHPLP